MTCLITASVVQRGSDEGEQLFSRWTKLIVSSRIRRAGHIAAVQTYTASSPIRCLDWAYQAGGIRYLCTALTIEMFQVLCRIQSDPYRQCYSSSQSCANPCREPTYFRLHHFHLSGREVPPCSFADGIESRASEGSVLPSSVLTIEMSNSGGITLHERKAVQYSIR
jgi:hypothetical protein